MYLVHVTLLQQIQNEAVETNGDIAALLRRCRILAQRLGVDEFKNWVVWELEGYPTIHDVPEYRIIKTPLILGHFCGYFGREIQNAQIPISRIPAKFRELLTVFRCTQAIGGVADILKRNEDSIRMPILADVIPFIGQGNIYEHYNLVQAVRCVNPSTIRDIIDQVQNRVLNFALELESRNPDAGEALAGAPKIPVDQVRSIFQTVINGGTQQFIQTPMHDQSISIAGNVVNSQVGQSLTQCTNLIQTHSSGQRKELLEQLQRDVQSMLQQSPAERHEEIVDGLERFVKEATAEKPNRRWYSVSADGLIEASKFVKDFSGNIASTIGQLGKLIWSDFELASGKER